LVFQDAVLWTISLAAFVAYGRWRLAPYRDLSSPSVLRPPAEREASTLELAIEDERHQLEARAAETSWCQRV
jgi:hypothetical protein